MWFFCGFTLNHINNHAIASLYKTAQPLKYAMKDWNSADQRKLYFVGYKVAPQCLF